jgi:hypothetical protein
MSRIPQDVKLWNFYTQQYEKENMARLQFHFDTKRGIERSRDPYARAAAGGLPDLNPMDFAKKMIQEQKEKKKEVAERSKRINTAINMRPVTPDVKDKLFDGFTKEEKGRYQYLKNRKQKSPEGKYEFPIISSWQYGWKLDDYVTLRKPAYARTRKIKDTFYTRTGIPTLNDPANISLQRSFTFA